MHPTVRRGRRNGRKTRCGSGYPNDQIEVIWPCTALIAAARISRSGMARLAVWRFRRHIAFRISIS